MTPLYFTAGERPKVAEALRFQVGNSLYPYAAYLRSAIESAMIRESRSACRWESVPREYPLRLDSLDTLLVVEADGHRYAVEGGPNEPPGDMPLFVGDEYRPMRPRRVERIDGRMFVVLESEIDEGERFFWSGEKCVLTAEAAWPRKPVARRRNGEIARITRRREEETRLVLVVEGQGPFTLTDERGAELRSLEVDPGEGAANLRIDGKDVPWKGQRKLSLDSRPNTDRILADNGVRWSWSLRGKHDRPQRGVWIQLLAPADTDSEAAVDVRAAYMDEGVREIRAKRDGKNVAALQVLGFDRDNYRLKLDELPPLKSSLSVPSNTWNLRRQSDAISRFRYRPLPHHRFLLRICENPEKASWPPCHPSSVRRWRMLEDDHYSGTLQQREFVEKALGTPDFAFLEGPPGSGKTHAICELILQFLERGSNVLLCSSTHVAVDNVLERLVGEFEQVEAVRIGREDRVDRTVGDVRLDARVSALAQAWRDAGAFPDLEERSLKRAAEEIVLASVNLTCGTSTGILQHPYIRRSHDESDGPAEPCLPYFDVLIVDEASKTTLQEFLVPAQLARKWIVVGDVRQLPPFSDPKDIEASIATASGDDGRTLSTAHREALLALFRLRRREAGYGKVKWAIAAPDAVLDALDEEIEARSGQGESLPETARVVGDDDRSSGRRVSMADIAAGKPESLRLLAADWILFPPELIDRLEPWIPSDAVPLHGWAPGSAGAYRFSLWHRLHGRFDEPVRERSERFAAAGDLAERQRAFLREESWANQVSWRLGRVHQLARARDDRQRGKLQSEVDDLLPAARPHAGWAPLVVKAIHDVGARSVIEALRVGRSDDRVRSRSALTEAIPGDIWNERAVLLEHQHRMHPDISALPREVFYEGAALKDANTLDGRDDRDGWEFAPQAPARRLWTDVRGREERGVNQAEVDAMRRWLETWRDYAKAHRRRDGADWTVACLSFYLRQEWAIRNLLREFTGKPRGETRFRLPNTVVSCATVDRFQGREADLVLLSLRNTSRAGHMDSPNRLNVGVTRARFMLVILGHRHYFENGCPSEELRALARGTPKFVPENAR